MNKYRTIGIYGAITALSVSLLGAYGFLLPSSTVNTTYTNSQSLALLGHVTLTVTDPQGNIKEYRQGDNIVINTSKSCTAKILFGGTSTLCASPGTAKWDTIGIGSGSTSFTTSSTRLTAEFLSFGLNRASASGHSVTLTDATGSTGAIETIQSTFTNTDSSSHTVSEAGLFNGTNLTTAGMFSAQTFTGVTLAQNDALAVKWTITVG